MASRVSLAVELPGVVIPTPVLGASGCVGSGRELQQLMDLRGVGGIITKSVTARPARGFPTPRMVETPSGMLNAIGLQNPGVTEFIRKDGPFIARAGVPVFVSIAGKTVQEFADVAVSVAKIPGVKGLEANLSSPNSSAIGAQIFAKDPEAAAEVLTTLTRMTHLPVFAKLTPDVTNIVEVAEACIRAGAHGLSLINTLMGMAIDVDTFRPRLASVTGGLSGPAIRPVALRAVFQVARALPEVPIIGMGGIRNAEDAIEFLLAGAWAVAVGTTNYFDPHAMATVADGIADYLARRGMSSPADLRGRVQVPAEASTEPVHRGG
ncbi:MAG TPA: dihydroorotate dehydrogenase [Actinomycetota bacterium]|nr:dihydroorotate dehydrogenase [Actinomycetota bacterium]